MTTVEQAMQMLYRVSRGTYQTRYYSTTARQFQPDDLLITKKFEIDPVLVTQPHTFVADTRFGSNDWTRTSNT